MMRLLRLALLSAMASGLATSAHAGLVVYTASLSGGAEATPNNSPGTGSVRAEFDDVAHTLRIRAEFEGLTSGTTAAHIHAATDLPFEGTAGVATTVPTFPNFPLGVTSGTYDATFDTLSASFYNPSFLTANGNNVADAEATLLAAMNTGRAYFNIHTVNFTGGEIRGFLTPVAVPEPSTLAGLAVGVLGALGFGLRRRAAR